MAIKWTLKKYLANTHGIYRVTDLQKTIVQRSQVLISYSNLGRYLRRPPKAIQLETLEVICKALNCALSDFLEITPDGYRKKKAVKKLSPKNATKKSIDGAQFPDPEDYESI